MNNLNGLRLASDIGGTFTDTVLVDGDAQVIPAAKAPTTTDQPALRTRKIGFASPYVPSVNDLTVSFLADKHSIEMIERLEAATGKPVVSSNLAMVYQAQQKLGVPDRIEGLGRLLKGELHDV